MQLQILEETLNLIKVLDDSGNDFWITRERLSQLNKPVKEHRVSPSVKSTFRLGAKMESVLSLMQDKQFRTLSDISALTGYESLTGLSAGIRSFRKMGLTVDKRKLQDAPEYEYRLA